jgi:hypothetical protein
MFQKNVIGERQDVGWQHGTTIDDKSRKLRATIAILRFHW